MWRAWCVGQGMTVVGIGIAVGVAVALGATRLMSSLLFNVGASDPSAYAGAGALLFVVAVLACAVPAFRAMRLAAGHSTSETSSTKDYASAPAVLAFHAARIACSCSGVRT